jgi:CheY-like chemotaxis protein
MKRSQPELPSLLIIEDSDEDFETLSRIINLVSTLKLVIDRCIDGDDALDFLDRVGKYCNLGDRSHPDLIILDLNLPGTDGREILATIKQSKTLKTIPVIVFSTSSNPKDIEACYQSGANSYMLKPMNINLLKNSVRMMIDYWFKATVLPNFHGLVQKSDLNPDCPSTSMPIPERT